MAHFNTHLKFVEPLISKLDKNYLLSGTVFPDIGLYVNFSNKKHQKDFTHFFHYPEPESKIGLEFGRALIAKAKTKEELSFAIGFYSHFCLDKAVHTYIMGNSLTLDEHIILEFFRAYIDFEKRVKRLYFPKKFVASVFEELYTQNKDNCDHLRVVGRWKLFRFKFITEYFLRHLIKLNYGKKQKKLRIIKCILSFFQPFYKRKYNVDLFLYLHPPLSLKKKHLANLNRIIEKTQKDFLKELKL